MFAKPNLAVESRRALLLLPAFSDFENFALSLLTGLLDVAIMGYIK